MPNTDFRAACYFEAARCLQFAGKQTIEQPEYWANLLGAAINGSLAAISDTVLVQIWEEQARTQERHEAIRKHLKEALEKRDG